MLSADLYQSIIGGLDHNHDKETLLSAAQCSRLLRAESQRILFRSTTWAPPNQLHRHKLFLEALLSAPERLCLYVREFTQLNMGWEPGYMTEISGAIQDIGLMTEIYELTTQALPLMVNLKKFQLHTLEWLHPGFEEEFASYFLPSQRALEHISALWKSDTRLPRSILPNLVSIQGPPLTLVVLAEAVGRGRILVYDCRLDSMSIDPLLVQRVTNALSGLKYARISTEYNLSVILHGNRLPDSIILIELTNGVNTVSDLLRYIPSNLRALVIGVLPTPRRALSRSEMENMASTVSKACPSLQYVEFLPVNSTHAQRILCPVDLAVEVTFTTIPVPNLDETDWWKRHLLDIQ